MYCKREKMAIRRIAARNRKQWFLLFVLLCSGCGRTMKASTKAVFNVARALALDGGEAVYRTGQQMGSGRGAVGSEGYEMPQGDLPAIDMGTVDDYKGW